MRLTEEVKRPELTKRKYRAINTCFFNSPGACANKLGEYEDIDESPERLAKVKQAFDIIKEKEVDIYGIKNSIDVYDYNVGIENEANFENRMLTEDEYDLLKEVLL